MAEVVVNRAKPVIDSIVLTLTAREAALVKLLVGNTAGNATEATGLYGALDRALPGYVSADIRISVSKDMLDAAAKDLNI